MIYKSKIYAESWNIAIRKKKEILFDTETPFNIIKNPFRYWIADPFLFEYKKKVYIFAEMYDYLRRRGVIGYATINNGQVSKWTPVIVEPYHLSYPFIYEEKGEIFIIPESGANRSLDVYRSVEFPNKWKKIINLREGKKYADTTLLQKGALKYGITYDVSDVQHMQVCLLDFLDNQDVCLEMDEIEKRRPAGNFFQIGDSLYRPAQNCVAGYGKGLIIYQVTSVEYGNYSEKQIRELFPTDLTYSGKLFLDGVHTYNQCENYEIIDIKTRRFNILNLFSRIYGKIDERVRKCFRGNKKYANNC